MKGKYIYINKKTSQKLYSETELNLPDFELLMEVKNGKMSNKKIVKKKYGRQKNK